MAEATALPNGWQETTLGKLGQFYRGHGGTREDEIPHGVPCVRYGDLYTHHEFIIRSFASFLKPSSISNYFPLKPGDIVFAGSGETFDDIGKAAVYCDQGPAFAGGDTIIFRPSERLDPCFAGYAVNGLIANAHKARHGQGSSVIHIGTGHLAGLPIKLPPLLVQQRLAHYLQTVDQAIEKTEALIEKYQQIKAGLMHDLFTRGIGSDGKLHPPREQAPELYQETPIGWIPKEWECSPLASKSRFGIPHIRTGPFGSALKGEHWVEEGVPVITIGALGEGEFQESELLFISEAYARRLSEFRMKVGDVVFSRVADVGRSVTVKEDQDGWVMSSNLMRISLDRALVVPDFLQFQLAFDQRVKKQIRCRVNSGGRDVANGEILNSLFFVWPSFAEQGQILQTANAVSKRIEGDKKELYKLNKRKSGLVHDLLTGKVPVNPDPSESHDV